MPLEPISYAEVESLSDQLERLAMVTPAIDKWCSGPDWTLSTKRAFAPDQECFLVGDPDTGVALLTRYPPDEEGLIALSGIEPMWGFASPILGPDPIGVSELLAQALAGDPDWDSVLLPGLPVDQSILQSIVDTLGSVCNVGFGIAIERQVADLRGGSDAWLSRRSSRFRRSLRRRSRLAKEAGVIYLDVGSDPNLFERLFKIESKSWKGQEDSGIINPEMSIMYSELIRRLGNKKRVRCLIASVDGADIGYILGGQIRETYRGLQLSFDKQYANLEVGHLLQWEQIKNLSGEVETYDMGMVIGYKARWADQTLPSPALILRR